MNALRRLCLGLAAGLGLSVALHGTPAAEQQLAVAGSPVGTIQDRNFERLFTTLRQNGIHTYFPTFQYEEVPAPRSLGFEKDFAPPCSPNDPSFAALRRTGMKLIIPGEFVYPDPRRLGRSKLSADPLSQIIACAGRERIAGITTYDEAAFHGIPLDAVASFYARVKQIDPTLPVLMVHGPIITDKREFSSTSKIGGYLQKVTAYSEYADIVGFDVYPVPAFLAKVATPLSGGAEVDVDRAIPEYLSWLNRAVPNKPKLIVLQGFAYTNLYAQSFLDANVPATLRAAIQAPSMAQMTLMLQQARSAGVDLVIWWGPSALPTAQDAPWPTILELGRRHGR